MWLLLLCVVIVCICVICNGAALCLYIKNAQFTQVSLRRATFVAE